MSALLEVHNISRNFGRLAAVHNVSMSVNSGDIRAIIGPNGAGKTTFFNLISGVTRPDEGSVRLSGRPITRLPAHRRIGLGMSRTFQVPHIFSGLTVAENLRLGVEASQGVSHSPWLTRSAQRLIEARLDEVLGRLNLDDKANSLAGELAAGDQRVVEIGLALTMNAKLLLLDEPTAGMSDEETEATIHLIRELWERDKMTVIFVEHDMGMVFEIAQHITVLHLGEVLAEGTPDEIAADERVQAAYLGKEVAA